MRQSLRKRLTNTVVKFAFLLTLVSATGVANSATRDQVVFFHNDHLGSAITAVNENAELCWRESYTPYGDKLVNNDVYVPPSDNCGLLGEERGYTGHTADFETGLTYMQQRYYDPTIGRFLSIDPLGASSNDVRTINRYSYAVNNPYRYTDPNGMHAADGIQTQEGTAYDRAIENGLLDGYGNKSSLFGDDEYESETHRILTLGHSIEPVYPVLNGLGGPAAAAKGVSLFASIGKYFKGAFGKCSFDGSTEVLTVEGYVSIEDMYTDQLVWSKDELTGAVDWKPIAAIFQSQYSETVYIEVSDLAANTSQAIMASRVHPFFVQRDRGQSASSDNLLNAEEYRYAGEIINGHWIDAENLEAGDRLLTDTDEWVTVSGVEIENRPLQAYNLEVTGFNTFFVRAKDDENGSSVWVHNKCNLNSNNAVANFGVYSIYVKGVLHKIGKAHLGRITKASGLPTRLHAQLRQLRKKYGSDSVTSGEIIDLGRTTTRAAKAVENAEIKSYVDRTGIVPLGNRKSYNP